MKRKCPNPSRSQGHEQTSKILQKTLFTMDPFSIVLSAVVILFLAYIFTNRNKHDYKNFPPGPKPLPIIGNVHMINMTRPHKTFLELSKMYGKIFSFQLGMEKIVLLCGYDTIKDALINRADEFSDRPSPPVIAKLQKEYGIVMANGENWKVMRRFTISTLRDFGMGKKTIENKIIEEAECLTQAFKSYGGKPFNHMTVLNAAVANIIVSILLNHRFEYDDPTLLQLMSLINDNIKLFGKPMVMLYNIFPSVMDRLPGVHKIIFKNIRQMQSFIRATFTKQKQELDVNNQRNLIDAFLAKQQEGKPESTLYYHNDNLIVLLSDLFAAGMETTTTTLRWGLLLMIKHPDIQNKVQNEIEKVIGSAQPQIEHRKQMPYTEAVINEIQRFGDIIPGNAPHATSQDVTFRGYFIPKGTTVFPLLTSVLKDPAYFEKPEEFYPEHFLTSEGHLKKNEAFIPFSIGKRSCAGENMAKMELFLFFTTLLQNFTIQLPPGAKLDLSPATGSINPPQPYEICAIPRS
ncbi:cytochrome P450 2C5-like [Mixophyes fleayi]|uniref:cytochrome P450 2C5-like n=1 Tax=Mixophyes fleayi TaxID=3061075 RepID=UPI003F4E05ED